MEKKELLQQISQLKEERHQLEEQMRGRISSEQHDAMLRDVFNSMREGVAIFSFEGKIKFINRYAMRMYNVPAESDVLQSTGLDWFHEESHKTVRKTYQQILEGGSDYLNDYHMKTFDGRDIWVEAVSTRIVFNNEDSILTTIRDASIRRGYETLSRESEELFRSVVDNSHDAIVMVNNKRQLVYVNYRCCEVLQRPQKELLGTEFLQYITDEDRSAIIQRYNEVVQTGGRYKFKRLHLLRPQGARVLVELNTTVIHRDSPLVVGQMLDISEKSKMEEEILNTRKLESVGVLAGGIAHDFNNILSAILGNITLARLNCDQRPEAMGILADAERATIRARGLTSQLLTFSSGGEPVRRSMNIERLVVDTVKFVLAGSRVRPQFEIADDVWRVYADEGQMAQAVHNLVINAVEAMPEGGELKVQIGNDVMSSEEDRLLTQFVLVAITDTGKGIPPDIINRIFDPYFTTRETGHGLGLASVHSIMQRHEGKVRVHSEPGKGSTFTLFIPATFEAEDNSVSESYIEEAPDHKRILLMDDEEMVRTVATRMLVRLGYEVTTASDGSEAIELYRKFKDSGETFHLVIMDLTVPGGMGGNDAFQIIREMDPFVKGIVSSGYFNDAIMARYREHGFTDVINKPFHISELAAVVEKVLH